MRWLSAQSIWTPRSHRHCRSLPTPQDVSTFSLCCPSAALLNSLSIATDYRYLGNVSSADPSRANSTGFYFAEAPHSPDYIARFSVGDIAMAKFAVSRDAFRGLFAFYAAKTHHEHDGGHRLLKLFASTKDIPDYLLEIWSDRTQVFDPEIDSMLGSRTRQIADGSARYDHASDFLHALLRDLNQERINDLVRPT